MENLTITKLKKRRQIIVAVTLLTLFSSCHSVRIVSRNGTPEPDPLNTSFGFYKGKKVTMVDTVISLKLHEGEFHLIEPCRSDGFYSIEYRVTLGSALLGAITFNKKRRVKFKYVCLKE